jgi:hypothetical protein
MSSPRSASLREPQLSRHDSGLVQAAAWLICLVVVVLALVVWKQENVGPLGSLTPLQIFPVLGLTAFSIMWSHYAASLLRQLLRVPANVLKQYFDYTSWVVLVLICLHPGLLIFQLLRDGAGPPPQSYEHYVAPGLGWVTLLGSASLLVFLAYEFRRIYGQKSWWRYMQVATDVAMLAIFYHALRLGDQLRFGWYRYVWWFYGISLVVILVYTYAKKYGSIHKQKSDF